jgi:parallel beta-helix repeat protein
MKRKIIYLFVALALLFSLIAVVGTGTVAAAGNWYVSTTGSDTTGDGSSGNPWLTINYAISQAINDDTINVAAGTYTEQVVINKNLTLSGTGNPMIKAPASPNGYKFPEGAGNTWDPIVLAFGGTADGSFNITGTGQVTVNISGITVDGNDRIPSVLTRRAVGILYRNVLGGVTHCTVQNMGYSTTFGLSWGIMAYGTSDATFHGNIVSGYAKGGFVVNGVLADPSMPKPHAVIDGNTVTGPPYDPALVLAPNGIQIGWGATGSVTNNTVTHHGSPGTVWGGTGILIQSSPGVIVEGNTVTGNQDYGIATAGYTSYGGSYATGTIIRNNTVEGNGQGIRIEKMSVDTVVQNNTITENKEGIHVGSAPLVYPIPPVGTVIHSNVIYSNADFGVSVETDVLPVDATNNWWGDPTGPYDPSDDTALGGWYNPLGLGDPVSDRVKYDPYLAQEAGVTGGEGCFIATAAYGSYLDSHVDTLRSFRDQYLETNPIGSAFVSLYYKVSPPMAAFIDEHPALKPVVRAELMPAVAMSSVALNTTLAEKAVILIAMALFAAVLIMWLMRRARRLERR